VPLVNMKEMLQDARKNRYAVGAFNIADMEMIMGVIKAAEELDAPVILQVTQGRLKYSPLQLIGPMMIGAANNSKVPVAVQLDHGRNLDGIKEALDLGFSSVMVDDSLKPIDENIRETKEVIAMAGKTGATVEAEVGQIGGCEGWAKNDDVICSHPDEVERLYRETHCDALALSIGNAHGLYKSSPKLQFDILDEAFQRVDVPLVLHGGSGISDEDFRKCVEHGISKINIATASFMAVEKAAREYAKTTEKNYFDLSDRMMLATYENVKRHILVFGSDGKAANFR